MPFAEEVQGIIRQKRLPLIQDQFPSEEFIMPCYEGFSIANLPATIVSILGGEPVDIMAPPLSPDLWTDLAGGVRHVVVVIWDGVGYLHFQKMLEDDRELNILRRLLNNSSHFLPITSVFPSTTAVALSSLFTGYTPAKHGLIGRKLCLREYGGMVDMLDLTPIMSKSEQLLIEWGMEPEKFLPVPTLAETLARQDIPTYIATHRRQINHGFWKMAAFRGTVITKGFVTSSDMWVLLRQMLEELYSERSLLVAYWGDTDAVSHQYGLESDALAAEIRSFVYSLTREFLQPLTPEVRKGTLLFIVSDHGHVNSLPEQAVNINNHPYLRDALGLPLGNEPRAAFLYVRNNRKDAVRSYFEKHLAEQFVVLDSQEVLKAGLFGDGSITPEVSHRIGDLIALSRGEAILYQEGDPILRSYHGGLAPGEMLAILLAIRLG